MIDRELLEAAARAAGLRVKWMPAKPGTRAMFWQTNIGEWNPMTDDGDALRLAVKLRLNVEAGWVVWTPPDGPPRDFCEPNSGDIHAATRRAIVRAAAAIGGQA